jgi:hypothetical protein
MKTMSNTIWERLDNLVDRASNASSRWRWLNYLATGATFIFLLWIFWRNWQSLNYEDLDSMGFAVLGCFLLYPLSFIPQIAVWIKLVEQKQPLWQHVEIYVRTHLMRRLPGGLWHWAGRTTLYRNTTGASSQSTIRASMMEWMLLLLASAASYGLFGISSTSILLGSLLAGLALTAAMLLMHQAGCAVEAIIYLLLYSLAWWLGGLMIYWLGQSNPQSSLTLNSAIVSWAVSGGISLASFFLPAGMGLRELSLTFFLGQYMPISNAITVAILLRVIFIIGDLFWGGLAWALAHRLCQRNTNT